MCITCFKAREGNTDGSTKEDLRLDTGITPTQKVAIVDAMAEVQALEKPDWIKNCSQLANSFTSRIFEKYNSIGQLQLIFDRLIIEN